MPRRSISASDSLSAFCAAFNSAPAITDGITQNPCASIVAVISDICIRLDVERRHLFRLPLLAVGLHRFERTFPERVAVGVVDEVDVGFVTDLQHLDAL